MNLRSRRQRTARRGTRCGWYIRQWERNSVESQFRTLGSLLLKVKMLTTKTGEAN